MNIKHFEEKYVAAAESLMRANYLEMQEKMTVLPDVKEMPALDYLCEHGIGFVALDEDDELVGGTYVVMHRLMNFGGKVKGAFSPLHGHGAVKENRKKIYHRLYQALAETLVKEKNLVTCDFCLCCG